MCSTIESLFKHGLSPNEKYENQSTALHHACQKHNIEIIKLLFEYGAEVTVDKLDLYPLDYVNDKEDDIIKFFEEKGFKKAVYSQDDIFGFDLDE